MKTKLLFFVICMLCAFTSLQAQNLVPNGSFETPDPAGSCPYGDTFGLNKKPQYWTGYTDPTGYDTSGDYFYPCPGTSNGVGQYPGLNSGGCELPINGQAYCGFLAASTNLAAANKLSEYVINNNVNLTAGTKYYVEFYVSNQEGCTGSNNSGSTSTAYSARLGMYLAPTNNLHLSTGQTNGLNNLVPQIPNTFPAASPYTAGGPTGTAGSNACPLANGWQKISGYFTPPSSGSWTIVIGNFDPGMNNIVHPNPNNPMYTEPTPTLTPKSTYVVGDYLASYYFVDAVTIIPATQTPPSYDPYVTGSQPVCFYNSSSFTLQNIPFGASASWSVSPANLFSGATSGTGATATLKKASKFGGSAATLTFTLTSPCGQTTVPDYPLWLGVPTANINTLIYPSGSRGVNPVTLTTDGTYLFYCDPVNYADSYTWYLPSGFSFYSGATTPSPWITTSSSTGNYTLFCSANNSCGSAFTQSLGINITVGGGGGHPAIAVAAFPNPTSATLTIQVTDSLSNVQNSTLDQPYQWRITDRSSRKVFSGQSNEKVLGIPVGDLPPDIYYLNFIYKDAVVQKQILIKR